jgi:hypothetical protein
VVERRSYKKREKRDEPKEKVDNNIEEMAMRCH